MMGHEAVQPATTHRRQTTVRWNTSVQRALGHMQNHLDANHSCANLAKVAALSPFHFNRVFRRLTGIPPAYFLAALRLEGAKDLIVNTELSITDICYDVGYMSLGTFVSRFTHFVGVSPGMLRRMARRFAFAELLRDIADGPPHIAAGGDRTAVEGHIEVDRRFSGAIFVALYDTMLPHARPLACAILRRSGRFRLHDCGEGRNRFVMAAAIPDDAGRDAYLKKGATLRAAYGPFRVTDPAARRIRLTLRPATYFDPPILAALPAMMLATLSRAAAE